LYLKKEEKKNIKKMCNAKHTLLKFDTMMTP